MFAAAGLIGALVGSSIGKVVDGHKLLILSAQRQTLTRVLGCMLVVVAGYMLYRNFT